MLNLPRGQQRHRALHRRDVALANAGPARAKGWSRITNDATRKIGQEAVSKVVAEVARLQIKAEFLRIQLPRIGLETASNDIILAGSLHAGWKLRNDFPSRRRVFSAAPWI
jgi:hypothetical protein